MAQEYEIKDEKGTLGKVVAGSQQEADNIFQIRVAIDTLNKIAGLSDEQLLDLARRLKTSGDISRKVITREEESAVFLTLTGRGLKIK